jgi:hypothetical protein
MWWVFAAWSVLWLAAHGIRSGFSWHYFVTGTHVLFSRHALHLYAQNRELQIGPVTFLVAAPFVFLLTGTLGKMAVIVAMSASGLALLTQIRRLQPARTAATDSELLILGLLVIPVWSEAAVHWAHLDDVLALLFALFGVRALRSQHPILAAALLGISVDCKPWALGFAPLLLLSEHHRLRAGLAYLTAIAVAWLPFYLGDTRTLAASQYRIINDRASVLRLLGVDTATTPSWCRPAQLALALILVTIATVRGRWAAAIMIGVAARLLLDPGAKNYYDAGLVAGSALYDAALVVVGVPWVTLAVLAMSWLPSYVLTSAPHWRGALRAVLFVGLIVIGLGGDLLRGRRHVPRHAKPRRGRAVQRRRSPRPEPVVR